MEPSCIVLPYFKTLLIHMMNKPILWMNKLDTQIFGYLFGYLLL